MLSFDAESAIAMTNEVHYVQCRSLFAMILELVHSNTVQ